MSTIAHAERAASRTFDAECAASLTLAPAGVAGTSPRAGDSAGISRRRGN